MSTAESKKQALTYIQEAVHALYRASGVLYNAEVCHDEARELYDLTRALRAIHEKVRP